MPLAEARLSPQATSTSNVPHETPASRMQEGLLHRLIAECVDRAADARGRATKCADRMAAGDYARIAGRWARIAGTYQWIEQIDELIADMEGQLRTLKGTRPGHPAESDSRH